MPVRSLKDGTIVIRVDDGGGGSPASVTVDLEDGDLAWTERSPVNVHRDRGVLSHARKAPDEVLELSFSMMFQSFLTHAAPTPFEALKNVGDASAWLSQESDSDVYAVDIQFTIADPAGGASEVLSFDRFKPEEVGLTEGDPTSVLAVSGRSPRRTPFALPTDIPGVIGRWAGYELTGLSDTDPVSSWPDTSGFNNDLAQGTGSKQPTYQTNELNGWPIVRFDGTDDFMSVVLASTFSQPNTLFLIAKHRTGSVTADEYMVAGEASDGSNESHTIEAVQATPDVYGANAGSQGEFGTLDTSYHIIIVAFDGASSIARIDRTQSTESLGTRNLKELYLGIGRDGSSGPADVDIAEAVLFRRKLSVAQMRHLEDYASWCYDL